MTHDEWWREVGSGMPPLPGEDASQHMRRVIEACWPAARAAIYQAEAAQLIASEIAIEREACAKACEGLRDLREEARAALRSANALKDGDEDTMLRSLRHESEVRLYNGGMDKAAAAIRARGNT